MNLKPIRLLLITPPYHAGVVEAAGSWPNLGYIYLAGQARAAGYEVSIFDAMTKRLGWKEIADKIQAYKPDYVGSTGYTSSAPAGIEVLRLAKTINSSIVTIMGGIHANFMYRQILQENGDAVDFVVRGEGEETLPELLRALDNGIDPVGIAGIAFRRNGKVIVTGERLFCKNLDDLIPAWDLVDWPDYTFYVMPGSRLGLVNSSRGCVNNCSFCSQQKFWQRSWRGRSPDSFVSELELLKQEYGVNVVMLSDEYPTKDGERWQKILDLLIERQVGMYLLLETCVEDIIRDREILDKYRSAGIVHVYLGVESTEQNRLLTFNKDIKIEQSKLALDLLNRAGIITECSFVLGMPDETKETVARTVELAKWYGPDFAHFLHIAPWPYADIYPSLSSHIMVRDYSKYNFTEPIVKPLAMTLEEIKKSLLEAYKSYYMDRMSGYPDIEDPFKKEYMIRSLSVMANNSFLKEYMQGDMPMPENIRKFVSSYSVKELN